MEWTLRAKGVTRFFIAAFLLVWLLGWAAGEAFALGALVAALASVVAPAWLATLLRGTPPTAGAALAMAGFLALWLTLWTIGGLAALRTFFEQLMGRDTLRFDGTRLVVERRAGPFRDVQRIDAAEVESVAVTQPGGPLRAETLRATRVLSTLGTAQEREAAAPEIANALGLATRPSPANTAEPPAPEGWTEVHDGSGFRVLRFDKWPHRQIRAASGVVVTISGAGWKRSFRPPRLRLVSSRDSDGDEVVQLVVEGPREKKTLARTLNETGAPLRIGRWLAAHTGVPLERA